MHRYLKIALPIFALIILLIPGYTYLVVNSNLTAATDFTSTIFFVFRLIGLYAFTLIWFQLILGPFMNPLSRLYGGKVLRLHRITGTLAFCLALTHGFLFHLGSFLLAKDSYNFLGSIEKYVGSNQLFYGWLGPIALTLLVATVTTALLMRRRYFNKYWRKIHFLNYLIFILVWLHSFNVGSDTQTEPLKTLYLFFMLTFLISFYYRVIWRRFLTKS